MHRFFNIAILLSFLLCYMDWGHDGAEFVGKTEYFFLTDINNLPDFFNGLLWFSPVFIGQIILLIGVIKPKPNKILTTAGVILLGLVALLIFTFGLLTLNTSMLFSTIPFFIFSVIGIIKISNMDVSDHAESIE